MQSWLNISKKSNNRHKYCTNVLLTYIFFSRRIAVEKRYTERESEGDIREGMSETKRERDDRDREEIQRDRQK